MVRASVLAMVGSLVMAGAAFAYAPAQQPAADQPAAPGAEKAVAQATAASTGDATKGRELFDTWSCGSCHTLTDAGASAPVGPSLDGNANLSHDLVVNRVTNGSGQMPGFGGQMTEQEIEDVAAYVMKAKK